MRRDPTAEHLPHRDDITLRAISTKDPAEAERLKAAARQSDQLIDELLESDLLVIATPMWNFGIPSALKAWIDLVVRPSRILSNTLMTACSVWRRARKPSWFWRRGHFYGWPVASVGFRRAVPVSNPGFHRRPGCADRSRRGNEHTAVGGERRAKSQQDRRGACSVRTVPNQWNWMTSEPQGEV